MRRLLLVLLMAIAGCGAVLGFGVSAYAADGPVAPVAQQGAVTPQANPDDVELEIFRLIALGKAVKEIAVDLSISDKTVATYLARIREKTGLNSHVEIARYALRHKLVE